MEFPEGDNMKASKGGFAFLGAFYVLLKSCNDFQLNSIM
jgi:hypothetical protein